MLLKKRKVHEKKKVRRCLPTTVRTNQNVFFFSIDQPAEIQTHYVVVICPFCSRFKYQDPAATCVTNAVDDMDSIG